MSILPEVTKLEFNTDAAAASSTTDLGVTYKFDFDAGEFMLSDGKLIPIADVDAIKLWVEKCLRTQRFTYQIYAREDKNEYGASLEDLIGSVWPRAFVESELKREISEALTRHPRIRSITDLTTDRDGARMKISFTLNLSDGQSVSQEVAVSG